MDPSGNVTNFTVVCTPTPEEVVQAQQCKWVLEGGMLLFTGTFGIIGNILSIVVLTQINMKNTFNHLLLVLVGFDTSIIIFATFDYSLVQVFKWPVSDHHWFYITILPNFIYPTNNILFCCSIYITLAIATERYLAVCHPVVYRDYEKTFPSKKRVCTYVIPAITFSIILNVPKFFEAKLVWPDETVFNGNHSDYENVSIGDQTKTFNDGENFHSINDSIHKKYEISYNLTDLRLNPTYIKYYLNYTRLAVTGVIPVVVLIFLNIRIIQALKYTHRNNHRGRRETSQSVILIGIVVVFFICHTPRVMLNLLESFLMPSIGPCFEQGFDYLPVWFHCLTGVNHFFLILNSSVNFLIYCCLGKQFRKVCNNLCWRKQKRSSALSLKTMETTTTILKTPEPTRKQIAQTPTITAITEQRETMSELTEMTGIESPHGSELAGITGIVGPYDSYQTAPDSVKSIALSETEM